MPRVTFGWPLLLAFFFNVLMAIRARTGSCICSASFIQSVVFFIVKGKKHYPLSKSSLGEACFLSCPSPLLTGTTVFSSSDFCAHTTQHFRVMVGLWLLLGNTDPLLWVSVFRIKEFKHDSERKWRVIFLRARGENNRVVKVEILATPGRRAIEKGRKLCAGVGGQQGRQVLWWKTGKWVCQLCSGSEKGVREEKMPHVSANRHMVLACVWEGRWKRERKRWHVLSLNSKADTFSNKVL